MAFGLVAGKQELVDIKRRELSFGNVCLLDATWR